MEHESAGLDLVRRIRHDLDRRALRIILHRAARLRPEMRVIREYDINDYKNKSELTRVRLLTTLTTAVKTCDQLKTIIMAARKSLAAIVDSAADLFFASRPVQLLPAPLAGIARLAGGARTGLLFPPAATWRAPTHAGTVIGTTGDDAGREGTLVESGTPPESSRRPSPAGRRSSTAARPHFHRRRASRCRSVLSSAFPLNDSEQQMLEVFCVNIGVGLENARIEDLRFSAFSDRLLTGAPIVPDSRPPDEHLGSRRTGLMALIDLDHFSELNDASDTTGRPAPVLPVARRLAVMVSSDMVLAR